MYFCRKSCSIGKVNFLDRRYFWAQVSWQGVHKPNEEYRSYHSAHSPNRWDHNLMRAVQLFARQMVVVLLTCNVNKYWAALERLKSPTKGDGSNIWRHSIIYPQVGSIIGWFAGYRAAVVRTGQGNKCRDELMKTLTESFPNGKVIIGAGIAYICQQPKTQVCRCPHFRPDRKLCPVQEGRRWNHKPWPTWRDWPKHTCRVFENPARDWTDMQWFSCHADNGQTSLVVSSVPQWHALVTCIGCLRCL